MFMTEEAYWEMREELASPPTTASEWDRAEAYELGSLHPEHAWILTDRDVWHRNPFYQGPPVPHPDDYDFDTLEPVPGARMSPAPKPVAAPVPTDDPDDIPF